MAAEPSRSSTASHSGPDRRSSTEVLVRNSALCGGQPREELLAHVVGHEAIVAREVVHNRAVPVLPAHGQRRQMEPGRPALGPAYEREHLVRRQIDTGLVHQPGGLGPGHRELLCRELDRAALGTHAPDRQSGVAAAREHELRTRKEGLPDCDHRPSSGRQPSACARRRAPGRRAGLWRSEPSRGAGAPPSRRPRALRTGPRRPPSRAARRRRARARWPRAESSGRCRPRPR